MGNRYKVLIRKTATVTKNPLKSFFRWFVRLNMFNSRIERNRGIKRRTTMRNYGRQTNSDYRTFGLTRTNLYHVELPPPAKNKLFFNSFHLNYCFPGNIHVDTHAHPRNRASVHRRHHPLRRSVTNVLLFYIHKIRPRGWSAGGGGGRGIFTT